MLSKFLEKKNKIYLQPRMGVASISKMQEQLRNLRDLNLPIIGTITVDSYTRNYKLKDLELALKANLSLNGFPILSHPPEKIRKQLSSIQNDSFPIQVRHGTSIPNKIIDHLIASDLFITEGGPISYCMPYSRTPLLESTHAWHQACEKLSDHTPKSHIESFAGCMLGQLCHPSLLVSLSILEGMFFVEAGLRDISFSYAQQYNLLQDFSAVCALKRLISQYINPETKYHVVIYTFMGLFPQTSQGHKNILTESLKLAHLTGAKRLITKTSEEAFNIPSFNGNVDALKYSAKVLGGLKENLKADAEEEESIYVQAKSIIDSVLNLSPYLRESIPLAFQKGLLDIPFCLHPDNTRNSLTTIDSRGYLQWIDVGKMSINRSQKKRNGFSNESVCSKKFLEMLNYNRFKFDRGKVE